MRPLLLATLLLALPDAASIQAWMEQAFYPALLIVLILASLGLPIPEDIPLIAAGVILRTDEGVATWQSTLVVALIGIMSGDLVLYMVGRMWGRDVVSHRSVRWIVTPARYERAVTQFHRHGVWFVFFGRFVMGVRAAMCLVAGATHFPYWRFFMADCAGAILSIPLFVGLGYWFASVIPTLRAYVAGIEGSLLAGAIAVVAVFAIHRILRKRRARRAAQAGSAPTTGQAGPGRLPRNVHTAEPHV